MNVWLMLCFIITSNINLFSAVSLPCTEDIPTCGNTCDKLLSCGRHYCTQKCHTGSCGTCRQMITKKCRCGKRQKNVVCSQDFLCEIKCQMMRQCERHQCRRKVGCPFIGGLENYSNFRSSGPGCLKINQVCP